MNCYIWEHVNHATDAYHTEGGVVVFAETEERARELANAEDGCKIHPEETPDYVREVIDSTERAFIFPNAGCC